jgi:hypothetical protein
VLAAVGLVLCGCGSTVQVVADDAAPPALKPVAPAPFPQFVRVDLFAPRVTPFHPAADDILRDLAAWDAATSVQRRARAEALAARIPGLALKEMKTFECGTQRHEVAIFLREPVMTGDDMELVLLPCGPPASPEAVAAAAAPGNGRNAREERIAADAPFLIARTEVSTSDWICGSGRDIVEFDPDPVSGVSYTEALEFCVNAGMDLPSSAQWDFACRAGATTRYFFGDDAARLPEFAWTAGNSGRHVHPPAEKLPNAFGLFDVYGNLREWCRDGQALHVCPRVNGQSFVGGAEPTELDTRAQFASKRPNVGFRPVYVIPDEKAWDEWPHREVARFSAKGARTYRLENAPDGKTAWNVTGAKADLFDADGRTVGKHVVDASGAIWRIGTDEVTARPLHERLSPNANAVPELQLIVKPVASSGAFARVTLVVRLHTAGGVAPAIDATRRVGDEEPVPYTADYVFLDTVGM